MQRRNFLANGSTLFAMGAFGLAKPATATSLLPSHAVHSDVIGPAAEVAEIQVYSRPRVADFTVSSRQAFSEALGKAKAGNVIFLAPGDYGAFATRRSVRGGQIRIVSETWRGARFSELRSEGDGLSWEGIDVTESRFFLSGANCRIRHCRARLANWRDFRNLVVEDTVIDSGYRGGQNNIKFGSGLKVCRTIFSRAQGTDLLQTHDIEDVEFENTVFFDLRQPAESDRHSDIFQCYAPRRSGKQRWRFYRCLFYTFDLSSIRSNQGLFLSDANGHEAYSGIDIQQCLFGAKNGMSRFGITVQFNGSNVVKDNTLFGGISTQNKSPADNSGTVVQNNVCSGIWVRSGGPFGVASANLEFQTPRGLFIETGHRNNLGWDWRDFDSQRTTKGAKVFTDHLRGVWG